MAIITIVTPCFNEEENVRPLYEAVKQQMAQYRGKHTYEHLFIDNASRDQTVRVLREMAAADPAVKVIINTRNFGWIRSPYHGLLQARGDAVLTMCADFQDPPELIPQFIERWESGYKVVLGIKVGAEESSAMFGIRSLYYQLAQRLSDVELIRDFTGFGLYDQRVVEVLRKIDDPYPYFRGLIAEVGYESAKIEYHQPLRRRGITKGNFYKLYDVAMLGITAHSKIPLRAATLCGFAMSGLSLLLAFGYLIAKLIFWNYFTLGTAPLLIGGFFFASVLLFFIGMLGEYIGAIQTQVMKRPLVIERERINLGPGTANGGDLPILSASVTASAPPESSSESKTATASVDSAVAPTHQQLRDRYHQGTIDKATYISSMHELHRQMMAYADVLPGTEISRIEISDGEVVMVRRSDGAKFAVNPVDKFSSPLVVLNFGAIEAEETAMILRLLKPGDTVLDVGANMGWHALLFARHAAGVRVHAFEPIPQTYRQVVRNVELNAPVSIQVHNFGFSDHAGEITFHFDPEFSGRASAVRLVDTDHAVPITCAVSTVDHFLAGTREKVDFIKCDVEGAELLVFRGARKTLERQQPIVFAEMLRKWSARFGYHPNDIIHFFAELGYRCCVVKGASLQPITEVTESTLETNYFFLHSVCHAELLRTLSLQ